MQRRRPLTPCTARQQLLGVENIRKQQPIFLLSYQSLLQALSLCLAEESVPPDIRSLAWLLLDADRERFKGEQLIFRREKRTKR